MSDISHIAYAMMDGNNFYVSAEEVGDGTFVFTDMEGDTIEGTLDETTAADLMESFGDDGYHDAMGDLY